MNRPFGILTYLKSDRSRPYFAKARFATADNAVRRARSLIEIDADIDRIEIRERRDDLWRLVRHVELGGK